MSNQQEDSQRSSMIVSMERIFNPAWFNRATGRDAHCTLSVAQYWDWLTYIDVRKGSF